MEDLWFEEELESSLEDTRFQVKGSRRQQASPQGIQQQVRGVVRVSQPLWKSLGMACLQGETASTLWLVRLRFQLATENHGSRFIFARYQGYLEPMQPGEPMPMVHDMYPQDISERNPQKVALKLSPGLKIASAIEASIGVMDTELTVGRVHPTVIGFPGEDDRAPYWDLTGTNCAIEGTHSFWLVLAQPPACNGIRLYTQAYGTIQTFWGPFPVHPKQQTWSGRPCVLIR